MNAIPERRADANFYDVEAIRRDNGRWVVVTTRGLILAR